MQTNMHNEAAAARAAEAQRLHLEATLATIKALGDLATAQVAYLDEPGRRTVIRAADWTLTMFVGNAVFTKNVQPVLPA